MLHVITHREPGDAPATVPESARARAGYPSHSERARRAAWRVERSLALDRERSTACRTPTMRTVIQ